MLSEAREVYLQRLRYKYFAYIVVRDAIGFYFGIPKFKSSTDLETVVHERLEKKIDLWQLKRKTVISDSERSKLEKSVRKKVNDRMQQLDADFIYCKQVLFEDNLWLQHLDLDPGFFKTYLPQLPDKMKDKLAVVPTWTRRDYALKRPYLVDKKDAKAIDFKCPI